ncbi:MULTISPECIES: imm11 family protein [Roseomonadaceae]|uniref:Immunity MXAN-0049 protein domain-containing protein n=1 Tax=Falsiroseomonas oleicola TaxID=2801474 RepID=A0ABS6HD91_9PROT|nr:DUF1629 domain-containing protein [Roseomonas oleicola]MBU8546389.1 hypothetical protein [Roseomonas oleicola]
MSAPDGQEDRRRMFRIHAVVILSEPTASLPAGRITSSFRNGRPARLAPGTRKSGNPLVLLYMNIPYTILRVDHPVPDSVIEAAAAQASWWPEAGKATRRHAAHLIIAPVEPTDESPRGDGFTVAFTLTEIAAAVVAAMPSAIAVYWPTSGVLQPAARAADFVGALAYNRLWLHPHLFGGPGQAFGIVLRGLDALIGHDLVVEPTNVVPPEDLHWRAMHVADRLMRQIPTLRDGDIVGFSETERGRVRLGAWPGMPGLVYRLTMEVDEAKPTATTATASTNPGVAYRAERAAADARHAGTAMRRYSKMLVSLSSTCLRGDKPALTYPARANPAHPPLSGDFGEAGWGGGRGWDRLRTPEAMGTPIRFQSRARRAEQIGDVIGSTFLGTMVIVSNKAAALMREFEPEGVDTHPVEITLATGEVVLEGSFHLFEATRDIPAVDLEVSGWRWISGWQGVLRLEWTKPDGNDVPRYLLRDEVLPDSTHLFRDRRLPGGGPIWVSNALREAMVAQGITGPGFAWGDRGWHTMSLEPQRKRGKEA